MAKIEVSAVAELAKRTIQPDPEKFREFVEAMNEFLQPDADDPAPPAVKKQFVILLSKPNDAAIIEQALQLCHTIEKIAGSPEQTTASVAASDLHATLKRMLSADQVGWVLQVPETVSPYATTDRIIKGAYDFNASKRGRMLPVRSIGEALESVGARFFKEYELWVKTKLPVCVVTTENVLPKDEFKIEKVDRRSASAGENAA